MLASHINQIKKTKKIYGPFFAGTCTFHGQILEEICWQLYENEKRPGSID